MTITNNEISNNFDGIAIHFGFGNHTIMGNTIAFNRWWGIYVVYSMGCNRIYHNNFVNNRDQTYSTGAMNVWDDSYPEGGNYWSDYNGTDADLDGIGDSPYTVHSTTGIQKDNYPLMGMFSDFTVWEDIPYHITTICNSTIYNFDWAYLLNITTGTWEEKDLWFSALGPEDTVGFCRIMIPRAFMAGPYTVYVYSEEVNATELPISNDTHAFLYFTYTHPTHITIIPEFPHALILPSFMIATLLAVIVYRRKKFHVTA